MIGEALVTLANHTEDENTREELYEEAKAYGADIDAMDDVETDEENDDDGTRD